MKPSTATTKKQPAKAGVHEKAGRIRLESGYTYTKMSERSTEFDAAAIDEIASQIGERVREQLCEIRPVPGLRAFGFNVIVDGSRIRLDSGFLADPQPERVSSKGHGQFDPQAAGRKVAAQLQKAEGGAWPGQELAAKYGLTPAALHKRRKEYRIVSWRDAKHQFFYPRWQFTPTGALLPGVQEVLQTFGSSDEWRVMRYFLAPRRQLDGRTPLDLLRAGEVAKVVAHAKAHGEENSW